LDSDCTDVLHFLTDFRWKVNKGTAADQVVNAVKVGYRLFDCAQDYDNEKVSCGKYPADYRNAEKASVVQLRKA
jgi:diketogulonate reductase-like aldo/keto reductase